MSRVKTSLNPKIIRRLIWLVLTMFVLLVHALTSASGTTYYSMAKQNYAALDSPPVILQNGTSASSRVYMNNTSANVNIITPTQNETQDYVDNNTSNVDSSADKGTHDNFSAQQTGPDSNYDTLEEGNINATVDSWGITSSSFTSTLIHTNYRYMGGTSPSIDNMTVTRLHLRYSGTGTVAIALYTGGTLTDPSGAVKRTEAYNVTVSSGWNTIDVSDYSWPKNTVTWIGWAHAGGSVYYSTSSADAGEFQSARGRWSQNTPADANEASPMPTNPSAGAFANYWYAMYIEYEAPNYEVDLEVQWTALDYNEANEELAICVNKTNTYSLDASGGYMIIGDGTPDWGSATGTISFWVKMDSSVQGRFWGQDGNMETRWAGTNLVLDWGATGSMTSAYSFSNDTWFFVAIVWDENNNNLFLYVGTESNMPTLDANSLSGTWTGTTPSPTQNRFLNSPGANEPVDGHGDDLRYWNVARTLAQIQSDYNTELTGTEANLRSYFKLNGNFDDVGPNNNDGSGSGSYSFSADSAFPEKIRVDLWNGSSWQNLFTDLVNGWNNVSVSTYLNSSTFTIRFKGSIESSDAVQDSWKIDVTLVHTWTSEADFNYVLRLTENHGANWKVRLKAYDQSNLARLTNCSVSIYDGSNSTQIVVLNGAYSQQTGAWYDLAASDTEYIWVHIERSYAGTSYVYAYLEVLVPNTATHAQYVVTFVIT
ncbi:hypothetical protein HXY33_05670 [Candidatus Bathyarchaeota archaeon]|nr:hypothetical protein [Candidatus Bathyarchaeota archaeon]